MGENFDPPERCCAMPLLVYRRFMCRRRFRAPEINLDLGREESPGAARLGWGKKRQFARRLVRGSRLVGTFADCPRGRILSSIMQSRKGAKITTEAFGDKASERSPNLEN